MVAAFILCCLIGYYVLDSVAKILNVRNLREEVPSEFAGIYEPGRYRESQRYLRAKTRFDLVSSTFDLACLLIFWGLGGFERVDAWLRNMHQGPVVTGILYLGILAAARELLELPFSAYATFVIEQRFGFNRSAPKTFLLDRLKAWILGGSLMIGFLTVVLNLLQHFGLSIWPVAWLITAAVGADIHSAVVLQIFSPAGRASAGGDPSLLPKTRISAARPVGNRWLTPLLQGECLLYRLWEKQANRAFRYIDSQPYDTRAHGRVGS
jgi:CAAX prenyl protease N-terminal, five membrane helices